MNILHVTQFKYNFY